MKKLFTAMLLVLSLASTVAIATEDGVGENSSNQDACQTCDGDRNGPDCENHTPTSDQPELPAAGDGGTTGER